MCCCSYNSPCVSDKLWSSFKISALTIGTRISLGSWEDGRNKQAPYVSPRILTASTFTLESDVFGSVLKITVQVANSLAAFTDGFIALSLIYLLWRKRTGQQRSALSNFDLCLADLKKPLPRTNGILNWLIIYTINSGAVTMWVMKFYSILLLSQFIFRIFSISVVITVCSISRATPFCS